MGYILITGANGFIGKHLLQYIKEEAPAYNRNIVLLTSSLIEGYTCVPHQNYQFTKADFLAQGINEIEIVIHAGAFTPKSSAEANNYESNFSNVINTQYLLENLPTIPSKFIFLSTLDVYQHTEAIIDEQTPAIPSGFYGKCKLFCEQMIAQWFSDKEGIPQILRIGHIYGPGEEVYKKFIPEAIRNIKQDKKPQIYTHGSEKRSYLHVKDCVRAIWSAVQLKEYIGPVNIVSSTACSINEIVELIIAISGKKIQPDVLKKDIRVWDIVFDNSKMKKYLVSESVQLTKGLREEYEVFKI
jgi:nucleoside-diphosphate-sugar epimerase